MSNPMLDQRTHGDGSPDGEQPASGAPRPRVDVVIPVLNEAHVLEKTVTTVLSFLEGHPGYDWRLIVVDNGSTDGTDRIARALQVVHEQLQFMHLTERGRGRALRHAWLKSDADVVCYFDVDLSTDLTFLPPLISAITEDGYDIAIGSRLMRESKTVRSLKREFISRAYNVFVKMVLRTSFSDAQCGFKAVSREAVRRVVPQVWDQGWFFDTELLVLAEKQGFRIKDLPVVWVEDDDSRVKIVSTAWADIKGVMRVRRALARPSREAAAAPAGPVPAAVALTQTTVTAAEVAGPTAR